MVGLFLYVGEKPSTYGLPLFITFVRPDQSLPSQLLRWVLLSVLASYASRCRFASECHPRHSSISLSSQFLSGRLMSNCPRMYSPGVMPVLFLNMRVK